MPRFSLALSFLALLPVLARAADDTKLIADERCYIRACYQFDWDRLSPGPLKEALEKGYLDKSDLRTLERLTKARLAFRKIDWEKEDWRDHAVVRFVCSNAGIQPAPEAERFMNTGPPAEGWAAGDLDDSGWPRQRKPWLVGKPELGFGVQNANVRTCYYRLSFAVPNPAEAGDLTLRLTYRGGVRVFINGHETVSLRRSILSIVKPSIDG